MREADERTVSAGLSSWLELMESAGRAVVDAAQKFAPAAHHFVIVCGKGNNGGDGLAAARYFAMLGKQVTALVCARQNELSRDAGAMFAKLDERGAVGVKVHVLTSAADLERSENTAALQHADLIIDALLGTGLKGAVEGFYAAVIARVNESGKPVLAVDLPSGADADLRVQGLAVKADAVVTFTAPKRWHAWSGDSDLPTAIAQIGTPATLVDEIAGDSPRLFTAKDLPTTFFARRADSNKGTYGHVLVVGGSLGKPGAPAMCAKSALRSGAGLATVACPGAIVPAVAGFAPEIMSEPLDGGAADCVSERAFDAVHALARSRSVVAVGPGLGRAPQTEQFVHHLMASDIQKPMVLDADGLNAFENRSQWLTRDGAATLVITPHPGEMARLLGTQVAEVQADRVSVAARFAQQHRCIVVLKGWRTVVAFPDGEAWINPTGNPGMSTGGTGDALTGIIAAFLAQHSSDTKPAVLAAVYAHGLAGDIAASHVGSPGMLASDLIERIPEAMREVQRQQDSRLTWLHTVA